MRTTPSLGLCVAFALVLFGAGCQSSETSMSGSSDSYQYSQNSSQNTQPAAPAATSSPSMNASTTASANGFPGILPAEQTNKKVRIKTTKGDIVIQVLPDQGPRAASNFVTLVKKGFYNGLIFHRVIPGFMIQGGDPTGTGMGGPGYEFQNDPVKIPYNEGIVAMANAGPDTNGSQFFIMVADFSKPPQYLDPNYSIFGRVIEGMDVAKQIAAVQRDMNDRPRQEVKMTSVAIEE